MPNVRHGQPKILIVDDIAANRLAMRTALKGIDAELVEASNGFDALAIALDTEFALILLDVQMPEIDGFEVCEQLRANPQTAETPVIFVTAASKADEDRLYGYLKGATDYLAKPINDQILKCKVQVFLRLYRQQHELIQANQSLQIAATAFDSHQGIVVTDAQSVILRVNRAFSIITGYDAEEVLGQRPNLWRSGCHDAHFYRAMWRAIEVDRCWHGEIWNRHRDGRIYPLWLTITGVAVEDGPITHYVANFFDITERKRQEIELTRHQEHLEEMVEERTAQLHAREADLERAQSVAAIGSWVLDAPLSTMTWSSETYRIFDIAENTPLNQESLLAQVHPEDLDRVNAAWLAAMRGRPLDIEHRILVGSTVRWVRQLAEFEFDNNRVFRRGIGTVQDITERKSHEEMIWRQANFDWLTGLANRNLIFERLERAIAQARRTEKRLGVMFLDLDGFKPINDEFGHEIGDQVLIEVASRLQAGVREQDTVGRLGGDEFIVVTHDLETIDDLSMIAEKLLTTLQQPFALSSASKHLSASIGVSVFPKDGDNVQHLIRHADFAMYDAKQAGKNRLHFFQQKITDGTASMQIASGNTRK